MTCMAACKDLASGREKERKHRRASYFVMKATRRGVGSISKSCIIFLQKSARSIFLTNMPAVCHIVLSQKLDKTTSSAEPAVAAAAGLGGGGCGCSACSAGSSFLCQNVRTTGLTGPEV